MNINKTAVREEIPIFFSTDDNYIPFLDVAIASLIDNASPDFDYRLVVLNTGLEQSGIDRIKRRERAGVRIDFVDITDAVADIAAHFKNVYHFSIATYYRLFIPSLFPEYHKIVYLDCDLVVTGDISELYHTDLKGNILGAVTDPFVQDTEPFRLYVERAVGVNAATYVNAGVLVVDLDEFRAARIEERFTDLITRYDFEVVDPDQAYLNYLCYGRILQLSRTWNLIPSPKPFCQEPNLIHFALYKKPWQFDSIPYESEFWRYAQVSPFHGDILAIKEAFDDSCKREKEAEGVAIVEQALAISASDNTFVSRLRNK